MKNNNPLSGVLIIGFALLGVSGKPVQGEAFDPAMGDDEILIFDEDELDSASDQIRGAEQSATGSIMSELTGSDETIVIEDETGSEPLIENGPTETETGQSDAEDTSVSIARTTSNTDETGRNGSFTVDEFWTELGLFPDSNAGTDGLGFWHTQATANWKPNASWEIQLSGRLDGYYESGGGDTDKTEFDYGETYLRYSADNYRLTLGTQTIIWGRIDEFPPTDRISTRDLSRHIIDDLSDRRRANPAIRYEYFSGDSKVDVVVLPVFRAPELPEIDSVWFPVNRDTGDIIGLTTTGFTRFVARTAPIDLDEPDSDGGFGLRYSNISSSFDYAITLQDVRQTNPYFAFNPSTRKLETRYPRSRVIGGDVGFEALGGTVKLEAAWQGDVPVTARNGAYTTVESLSWGAALELFPGDGDTRLNLQFTGFQLLDSPPVLDRAEVYAFNGTWETPFNNEQWRLKTRFYIGIGESDKYLNPEIAYTGWNSQELYLEAHLFRGSDTLPGGYHEDHSLIAAGWRIKF